jgi:hypothetical protein
MKSKFIRSWPASLARHGILKTYHCRAIGCKMNLMIVLFQKAFDEIAIEFTVIHHKDSHRIPR